MRCPINTLCARCVHGNVDRVDVTDVFVRTRLNGKRPASFIQYKQGPFKREAAKLRSADDANAVRVYTVMV